MNLLYRRDQSSSQIGVSNTIRSPGITLRIGRPRFKLWAKLELDQDERAILDHYRFDTSQLVESYQPDLMRQTAVFFGMAFIAAYILLWMLVSAAGFWLPAIFAAGAAYFYYDRKRETIYVSDLLHGHTFVCRSVVELARKEAWLEVMVMYLRQVMESARSWDGIEAIPIAVLHPDEAKRMAIQGP